MTAGEFSRFDEVLRGGIGKDGLTSTVLSELRDNETTETMMAHLNQALRGALTGLVPENVKVRFVLREDGDEGPARPPISGGAPLIQWVPTSGPRRAPQAPQRSEAPRRSRGAPRSLTGAAGT
jgi:hypothetical protein